MAIRASSLVQTVLSVTELHRILTARSAVFADCYRRSGISPCPEDSPYVQVGRSGRPEHLKVYYRTRFVATCPQQEPDSYRKKAAQSLKRETLRPEEVNRALAGRMKAGEQAALAVEQQKSS